MSDEYDVLSVGVAWIPDETLDIVKVSSVIDNLGGACFRFDTDYQLYLNRDALVMLTNLFNETIIALDNTDFTACIDNVIEFKRGPDK